MPSSADLPPKACIGRCQCSTPQRQAFGSDALLRRRAPPPPSSKARSTTGVARLHRRRAAIVPHRVVGLSNHRSRCWSSSAARGRSSPPRGRARPPRASTARAVGRRRRWPPRGDRRWRRSPTLRAAPSATFPRRGERGAVAQRPPATRAPLARARIEYVSTSIALEGGFRSCFGVAGEPAPTMRSTRYGGAASTCTRVEVAGCSGSTIVLLACASTPLLGVQRVRHRSPFTHSRHSYFASQPGTGKVPRWLGRSGISPDEVACRCARRRRRPSSVL